MRRLKILLLSLLACLLVLVAGYKYIYHIPGKNFLVKNTRAVYVNENFNRKSIKPLEELLLKIGEESHIEDLKKEKKYIKNIYILYFGSIQLLDEHRVGVLDPGLMYPIFKSRLGKYFEKSKDYYILKEKYREKYSSGKEVFLKGYRGYFLVSDSKEDLEGVLSGVGESNENILALKKRDKANIFGKLLLDLTGTKGELLGLKGSVVTANYDSQKFYMDNKLVGEGGIVELFKAQPEERKMEKYLGKNRIYISSNDFSKAAKILAANIPKEQKVILDILESFSGGSIEDFLGDIDGEIVGDIEKNRWIIPLKETKRFEKLFMILGKSKRLKIGNISLMMEGKNIYQGREKLSPGTGGTLSKKEFFQGEISLDLLDRKFSEKSKISIKGRAEGDYLNLHTELSEETLDDILIKMKK
ncbi:hypothetical protein [uncultured Ilyobacter sp.]|uniref:hypothetical protein n=1 Tax=uncultured Ilyobacter sp. TaxID=544433 RepID=UPI002AA885B8|nr:hypothetical protein [uncultured Ilyobacter sp.]